MLLVDDYRCPPSRGPPYSYSCNIACRGVMRHTEIDSNQATIAQLCITIKLHNNTSFETGRESYTLYSLTTHNQVGKTLESRKSFVATTPTFSKRSTQRLSHNHGVFPVRGTNAACHTPGLGTNAEDQC